MNNKPLNDMDLSFVTGADARDGAKVGGVAGGVAGAAVGLPTAYLAGAGVAAANAGFASAGLVIGSATLGAFAAPVLVGVAAGAGLGALIGWAWN